MTPNLHYLLLLSDKDSPASLIWPNSAMISLMKLVGIMARLVTRPSLSTYVPLYQNQLFQHWPAAVMPLQLFRKVKPIFLKL